VISNLFCLNCKLYRENVRTCIQAEGEGERSSVPNSPNDVQGKKAHSSKYYETQARALSLLF
jgi:hypothetical protein